MQKSINAYQKCIGKYKHHNREKLIDLIKKHNNGNNDATNEIVKTNSRLVLKIAGIYRNKGVDIDDLIQEGNLGLLKAIEKFDENLGYEFSTYATWWIRQYIVRAIYNARLIRIPINIIEIVNKVYNTKKQLEKEYGTTPSLQDIADICEEPIEKIVSCIEAHSINIVSIDKIIMEDYSGESEGIKGECLLSSDSNQEKINNIEYANKIMDIAGIVNKKERTIFLDRIGANENQEIRKLKDIKKDVLLSEERIRQIENKVRKILKEKFIKNGILDERIAI